MYSRGLLIMMLLGRLAGETAVRDQETRRPGPHGNEGSCPGRGWDRGGGVGGEREAGSPVRHGTVVGIGVCGETASEAGKGSEEGESDSQGHAGELGTVRWSEGPQSLCPASDPPTSSHSPGSSRQRTQSAISSTAKRGSSRRPSTKGSRMAASICGRSSAQTCCSLDAPSTERQRSKCWAAGRRGPGAEGPSDTRLEPGGQPCPP